MGITPGGQIPAAEAEARPDDQHQQHDQQPRAEQPALQERLAGTGVPIAGLAVDDERVRAHVIRPPPAERPHAELAATDRAGNGLPRPEPRAVPTVPGLPRAVPVAPVLVHLVPAGTVLAAGRPDVGGSSTGWAAASLLDGRRADDRRADRCRA